MRKKMAAVLILILIPLLFSGCYDSVEINDYAYVTLMGIDKGVSDKLRLTFQVPIFRGFGGAGGEDLMQGRRRKIKKISVLILLLCCPELQLSMQYTKY